MPVVRQQLHRVPARVPAGRIAEVREERTHAHLDLWLVEIKFLPAAFHRAGFVGGHFIEDGAGLAVICPVAQQKVFAEVHHHNEAGQEQHPVADNFQQPSHESILQAWKARGPVLRSSLEMEGGVRAQRLSNQPFQQPVHARQRPRQQNQRHGACSS